jgi:hypothetical protein
MSNAWQRQCTFPSAGYTSPKRGIWHDVKVGRDSAPMVTDRDTKRGHASDCSGNLVPVKPGPARSWAVAKVQVERFLNTLPLEQRNRITPAQKWQVVEVVASGKLDEVAAMLA